MEAPPLPHGDSQRAMMRQNDINERMRTIAGQLTHAPAGGCASQPVNCRRFIQLRLHRDD